MLIFFVSSNTGTILLLSQTKTDWLKLLDTSGIDWIGDSVIVPIVASNY